MRKFIPIIWGMLVFACNPAENNSVKTNENNRAHPNIIFILIDDMGFGDLHSYGNAGVRTPHIDRLAREGIRFTQYYVNSPICSPSRVAVTTGQYPLRWNITSYLADSARNIRRGMAQYLDPAAPSLARVFQASGYYTAHVGKWHMGGQRNVAGAPMIGAFGFDASLTSFEGLGERIGYIFETREWEGSHRFPLSVQQEKLGHGEVRWVNRYKSPRIYVDRALEEIKTAEDKGMPFYLNLWTDAVHTPLEAPPDLRGNGSIRAHYYGVIQELDKQLGRLFEYIDNDPELRENTVIVLSSDNGPSGKIGSSGGLRGHKGNLYEGGIREPFIVWAPGKIQESNTGKVNTTTVLAGMDLPPSLLAIAGVTPPDSIQYDGLNMSKVFLGESAEKRKAPVMWVRPTGVAGPENEFPDLAIREGKWKLVVNTDGSNPELYNLQVNPGETINVAEANAEVAASMQKKVLDWFHTVIDNTTGSVEPWE